MTFVPDAHVGARALPVYNAGSADRKQVNQKCSFEKLTALPSIVSVRERPFREHGMVISLASAERLQELHKLRGILAFALALSLVLSCAFAVHAFEFLTLRSARRRCQENSGCASAET